MSLQDIIDYFRATPRTTASVARERLQIVVAHERSQRNGPDYLPMLQRELLDVVARYVKVDTEQVKVEFGRSGDYAILELNVTLSDTK